MRTTASSFERVLEIVLNIIERICWLLVWLLIGVVIIGGLYLTGLLYYVLFGEIAKGNVNPIWGFIFTAGQAFIIWVCLDEIKRGRHE